MAGFSRASILIFLFFFSFSEAREILVGGKTTAWKIPSSQSQSLNQWAESSRFHVGDTLLWNYEQGKDSVLQVTKEDYEACNIKNPVEEHDDGETKVKLNKAGPFYFISGEKGHCEQGQKVVIVVMSPRHRYIGISPSPSPVEFEGPAVAPSSTAASLKVGFVSVIAILGFGFALM